MAAEACSIVSTIRFEERQTLWTAEYENSLASDATDIFPGMMFTLARPKIEQSKLWQIVKKMPKGALLHCHIEAMVDIDWLVERAFATNGTHISAEGPLDPATSDNTIPFQFKWLHAPATPSASIWSDSYVAGERVPIDVAAESFPHGGRDGFKRWLVSRTTITHDESLQHHHGPNDIWRKFTSCFGILASLLFYEPTYRMFLRRMFKDLLDDGVRYVDIRSAFLIPFYKEDSEEPEDGYEYMIDVLDDEIEKFKESVEGEGFWGARLIYTCIRSLGTKRIVEGE